MIREFPRQAQLKDEEVPSCRSVAVGKVAANGGFHKYGYPNSWMVYFMENPTKMDENWGYPYFRKPPNHLCVIGLVCLRENLQQSQKPFLWERPWISSCVRLRLSRQSIESDVVNVNPGLINPKRLFNFGWYHLSIRWNDYWRSTPLINKPWFINPGLTLTWSNWVLREWESHFSVCVQNVQNWMIPSGCIETSESCQVIIVLLDLQVFT